MSINHKYDIDFDFVCNHPGITEYKFDHNRTNSLDGVAFHDEDKDNIQQTTDATN